MRRRINMVLIALSVMTAGCMQTGVTPVTPGDGNGGVTDPIDQVEVTVTARLPEYGGQAYLERGDFRWTEPEIEEQTIMECDQNEQVCEGEARGTGDYRLTLEVARYRCVPFYFSLDESGMKSGVPDTFDWSTPERCGASLPDGIYYDPVIDRTEEVWTEERNDRLMIVSSMTGSIGTLLGDMFRDDSMRCTLGSVSTDRQSITWHICDKPAGGCEAITIWDAEECGERTLDFVEALEHE